MYKTMDDFGQNSFIAYTDRIKKLSFESEFSSLSTLTISPGQSSSDFSRNSKGINDSPLELGSSPEEINAQPLDWSLPSHKGAGHIQDYVYRDDYEEEYTSVTAESESEIEEYQLRDLIKAVEIHCEEDDDEARKSVHSKLQAAKDPYVKITHCLTAIVKMQNYYTEILKSIEDGMKRIKTQLVTSKEEMRIHKYKLAPNSCLEKLPSFPYFRDKKKFGAPMNADTIKKKSTEGFNFQRLPATIKWQKWEMKLLDLAVRKEVFLSLEHPLAVSKQNLEEQLSKKTAKGRPTKKTRRLLKAINGEIDSLTAEPMFEILYNCESPVDWMKISTIHFKGKRSPEECEGMWITNQNVKINRDPWTKDEIDRLVLIAKEHNDQNWEKIASIVGNGRSAFQCALYQQLQLNHERAKWSPAADKKLTALVKEYSRRGFIDFEKIASLMPGRTCKQVRRRWNDTIDPTIRKGYFTKTEDTILSTARFYHKLNFRQIARLLPGRTPNQLRCRYTRLEFLNPKQPWCKSEDEKLLFLILHNNKRNWNYMVRHFNDRNLQQLRARYHRLRIDAKRAGKKLMLLNPDYDPSDEAQVEMNYVPDYKKEHSEKSTKYVPVTSLMKMVNRKRRRGKKCKKPDLIDKEISIYFRTLKHMRKQGRDKKHYDFGDVAEMTETQAHYAEILCTNLDWDCTDVSVDIMQKTLDSDLVKDFKSEELYHLMREFRIKHDTTGWDPTNTKLTKLIPPCYGSLTGMRSLMLSKPILEALDESSDEEKDDRKQATEKLDLKGNLNHGTFGFNIANRKIPTSVGGIGNVEHTPPNSQPVTPQHSPESNKLSNLTPPVTPVISAVVHTAVPKSFRYKDQCLTPEEAFQVNVDPEKPCRLPVAAEEATVKAMLIKHKKEYLRLKKEFQELKKKQRGIEKSGDTENPMEINAKLKDLNQQKENLSKESEKKGKPGETMYEISDMSKEQVLLYKEQFLKLLSEIREKMGNSDIAKATDKSDEESAKRMSDLMIRSKEFVKYVCEEFGVAEEGIDDGPEENDTGRLSFANALYLWIQRFLSIFYLPGVMAMVRPAPNLKEDLYSGERMACKYSDEMDTSSESDTDPRISPIVLTNSPQPGISSQDVPNMARVMKKTKKKKSGDAKADAKKNHKKYDLENPPIPESERKCILLEKWLKYRNHKIHELEERKKRGLRDKWDEEQARLEAIDREEANRETVERIPGKRGRPRRLRRKRKCGHAAELDKLSEEEDDPQENQSNNMFLQKQPPLMLEIHDSTLAVLEKFKAPLGKITVPITPGVDGKNANDEKGTQ